MHVVVLFGFVSRRNWTLFAILWLANSFPSVLLIYPPSRSPYLPFKRLFLRCIHKVFNVGELYDLEIDLEFEVISLRVMVIPELEQLLSQLPSLMSTMGHEEFFYA